ncbi:hypothetical protein SAMN05216410_0866 [Sanguibacter gelidistatuariae]|uniref:LPXTG-motif cell wall anchor domain-containing protein n=2 Tax=Sanguibacter gelidistatuariae TaxID=1814289 RepID=A0A1G6HA42_9MICO|nr:hypothetical protein SAMN05216410_0866 [Sanguibacter gelidistatuariae]
MPLAAHSGTRHTSRALAFVLALAVVGGAAVAAALPVQAESAVAVTAADIRANATTTGWHLGASDAGHTLTDTPGSLVIGGEAELLNGLVSPLPLTDFSASITGSSFGWTTAAGSGPTFGLVQVSFGANETVTTLSPVDPVSGSTVVRLADRWTFSGDIGAETGSADRTLGEVLDLLTAQSNPRVVAYGVRVPASATTTLSTMSWNGAATSFGGAPAPELPPLVTGTVTISGTPMQYQPLSADTQGWNADSLRFQWFSVRDGQSEPIAGATQRVYASPDIGVQIGVAVMGIRGDETTATVNSALTAPIVPLALWPMDGVAQVRQQFINGTLEAETYGWPVGTAFSYQWFWHDGTSSHLVEGATGKIYTLAPADLGRRFGVIVTGTLSQFATTSVTTGLTTAVEAPPPVVRAPIDPRTTAELMDYLRRGGISVGSSALPAPFVAPAPGPTAALFPSLAPLAWGDSRDWHVDVYLFSEQLFIGTFPVVNGVAQIKLTGEQLAAAGAGEHTLVAVGQQSGAIQAAALTIAEAPTVAAAAPALAATGAEAAPLLGVAALLLALGAALVVLRRRLGTRA